MAPPRFRRFLHVLPVDSVAGTTRKVAVLFDLEPVTSGVDPGFVLRPAALEGDGPRGLQEISTSVSMRLLNCMITFRPINGREVRLVVSQVGGVTCVEPTQRR